MVSDNELRVDAAGGAKVEALVHCAVTKKLYKKTGRRSQSCKEVLMRISLDDPPEGKRN